MPKYDCAVFDLDGTILDTLDDLTYAVNHAMAALNRPAHDRSAVRRMIGNGVRMIIVRALGEGATEQEIETALADFRKAYAGHIDVFTREYEGVTPLLKKLRQAGVKTCVCSNKYDSAVQALISAHFPGLFDAVAGEGEGIPKKPAPEGTWRVIERAGGRRETACYIGDSPVDLQTAANAGLPCVTVSWGFADRDRLTALSPEILCDTVEDLERVLLGE